MANRPVVLVYQEYANLSVAPATPELDAAIVGPAYQIVDYPEDRLVPASDGSLVANVAGIYGSRYACAGTPMNGLQLPYSGLLAGAVPDPGSVQVYAENVRGLIALGGAGGFPASVTTIAKSVELEVGPDLISAGVLVGDWCTFKDAGGHVTSLRVRGFKNGTGTNDVALFSSEFSSDGPSWTNGPTAAYQFERDLGSAVLPAGSVMATADKVTVSPGFAVAGLPVLYAELLVAYLALRTDLARYQTLSDLRLSPKGELGNVGRLDARNPLAVGLYVAAQNSNTPLQYFGIPSDDDAGYQTAKGALTVRNSAYAVALLTDEPAQVKSFGDAFLSSADPDYAITNGVSQTFRVALGYAGSLPDVRLLKELSTAASVADGVLSDPNGGFVDAGVVVGDRIRFQSDPGTQLQDLPIVAVVSNETLRYSGAAPAGLLSYEVVRDISADKNAQVAALVALAKSFGNRRVVLCWPDLVRVGDLTDGSKPRLPNGSKAAAGPQPGYYLACAVVAMTAALPSHQGFTNFAVNGIEQVYNATPYFTDRQISALSNAGLCVFAQDDIAALPYIVHALTTDVSALAFSEYMTVKNMDYVSMAVRDVLDGFLGKWNITNETLDFVRSDIQSEIDGLLLDKRVRIGARLRSAKLTLLEQSTTADDRIECFVEAQFPMVLNTIGLHIVSS